MCRTEYGKTTRKKEREKIKRNVGNVQEQESKEGENQGRKRLKFLKWVHTLYVYWYGGMHVGYMLLAL